MANLYGRDAIGGDAYLQATGAGTNVDPFLVGHDVLCKVLKTAQISNTASADLVALVADKKIRVINLVLTASANCTIKLQSGGSTDLTPAFHLLANGHIAISNELGVIETLVGEKLNVVLAGSATYTAFVTYREV